jgi:hypothetical protein
MNGMPLFGSRRKGFPLALVRKETNCIYTYPSDHKGADNDKEMN